MTKTKTRTRKRLKITISPSYKKRLKNLSLALLVVLATTVSLFLFALFQRFAKSMASASSGITVNEGVDLSGRFNILLGRVDDFNNPTSLINTLSILTVEVRSRKAGIYQLPTDLEVGNLGGFGQNKIYSLYGLANLTLKKDINFISDQVQEVFSLPIDGFLFTDNAGFSRLSKSFGEDLGLSSIKSGDYLFFLKHVGSLPQLFGSLKTNLDTVTLLNLFNKILSNRFNTFESGKINASFVDNPSDYFLDSIIEEEAKTTIVLNGTKIPLLASSRARLIRNIGGRVLETANAPGDPYPKSVIISNDKQSYTLKRLSETFGISDLRLFSSFEDDPKLSQFLRADIIILLGPDSANSR